MIDAINEFMQMAKRSSLDLPRFYAPNFNGEGISMPSLNYDSLGL